MDKIERVVVHIGTEKTGSTSLQKFLSENRLVFHKGGYGILKSTGQEDDRSLAAFCMPFSEIDDFFRDRGVVSRRQRRNFNKNLQKQIDIELMELQPHIHTVILSSEHFQSRLTKEESVRVLYEFLSERFHSIEIIAYFREQSSLLLSQYSTAVKTGSVQEFEFFLHRCQVDSMYFNYYEMFSMWRDVFGRKNLIPRIYHSDSLYLGDVRKDFVNVLSLNVKDLGFSSRKVNSSLGSVGVELLRVTNSYFPRYDKRGELDLFRIKLVDVIAQSSISEIGRVRFPGQMSVYNRFNEVNTRFAREFLDVGVNPFSPPVVEDYDNDVIISRCDLYQFYKTLMDELCFDGYGGGGV